MSATYSNEELLRMYYHLKRGRIFTLKMHECVNNGLIRSSFHTPYGQEAQSVGMVSAMRDTDWFAGTHRDQPALIMRWDLKGLLGELFGLDTGTHGGLTFDFHHSDYRLDGARVINAIGTLGGMIPQDIGYAWALKQQGKDEIVVMCHGDGGCSEGSVYEGWNLAALYKAPIVHVIENNGWAMTVPLERETANPNIAEKAGACGLPYQIVDGSDLLAIREAMDIAIAKARNFEPNVVEIKAKRWGAHFYGQPNDYRDDLADIEDAMENHDCVKNYEKYLMDKGLIDQAYIDELSAKIEAEIDEAVREASKGNKPTYEAAFGMDYIYATPETGGEL